MIREGYADANGLKWHFAETGDVHAPATFFLHGFPEFSGMWKRVITSLGDHLHCIAPDLTGYNLSEKPADLARYRTRRVVEDLASFIDMYPQGVRGDKKINLVAHDWGGALAWAFALRFPEWVNRLVIINAVHPAAFQREMARNPDQAKASQYILDIRAEGSEARFAENDFALLRRSFRQVEEKGLLPPDELQEYRRAWGQPGALTGMFNWYRAMKLGPERGQAPPAAYDPESLIVRVKTLVLWGEKDESLLPGCLDGLDAFVPGVEIRRFPQSSHWLVHEEPEAVIEAIRGFCTSNPPG